MVHQIVGNLLSGILLKSGVSNEILFVVFAVIALAGGAMLFLLSPPAPKAEERKEEEESVKKTLLGPFTMFTKRNFLLLVPLMIYNGIRYGLLVRQGLQSSSQLCGSGEFVFGSFPPQIGSVSTDTIGFAMTAFGVTNILSSIIGGKVSDRIGRLPVVIALAVFEAAALVFCYIASPEMPILYYVATCLLGVADGLLNTQIYSTIGFLFADQLQYAFSGMLCVSGCSL